MNRHMLPALLLAAILMLCAACGSPDSSAPGGNTAPEVSAAHSAPGGALSGDTGEDPYRIGIITNSASVSPEEPAAALRMQALYGERVLLETYPDSYEDDTAVIISHVLNLAAEPDVRVIVFAQAPDGAAAAIDKVRETRPDILFICATTAEEPGLVAESADIVLQADPVAMARDIVKISDGADADTIVYYTSPRHLDAPLTAYQLELVRELCGENGLRLVQRDLPAPPEAGARQVREFLEEDIPAMIALYGESSAFFATSCAVQETLITGVLEGGAIFPLQPCPSPYLGFPEALGIAVPEDEDDLAYLISRIRQRVESAGGGGRMASWRLPIGRMTLEAGVRYGIAYCEGDTDGRVDIVRLRELLQDIAAGDGYVTIRSYDLEGQSLDNLFLLSCDSVLF